MCCCCCRVREELNEERERNEKLRGQLNEVEMGQRESGRRVEMVMGEQRGTQKALEALRRERTGTSLCFLDCH